MRSKPAVILVLALAALIGQACRAEKLNLATYLISDPAGKPIPQVADNRLETAWESAGPQQAGMSVLVDCKTPVTIHRLYLTPGTRISRYPRALKLSIGDAPDRLTPFLEKALPIDAETDLRFNPVSGRYLRIAIAGDGAGYPWTIAEMELYGARNPGTTKRDCVVREGQTETLTRAAEDLRYYVSELTGTPIPLVTPEDAKQYPGTIYRVTAPAPLPAYDRWVESPAYLQREKTSVIKQGREVIFGGVTELAVLYSVYDFLDSQGVRWLYPDSQGDYVPASRGIKLDMLPISRELSFSWRMANWNTQHLLGRPGYLWYYRNRWSNSWGGPLNERPGEPRPAKSPYFGQGHTFQNLIPGTMFTEHPDWFPLFRPGSRYESRISGKNAWKPQPIGQRVPYETTYGLNFCTGNPEVIDFVANKILDNTVPSNVRETAWLAPQDSGTFCECDHCRTLDDPDEVDTGFLWFGPTVSCRYATFVTSVAGKIREKAPNVRVGLLAYSTYRLPPRKFPRLPDNVVVDVCQYDAANLPMTTSKTNAWWKGVMEGWSTRWTTPGHLGVYDYALLDERPECIPAPKPYVTALADKVRFYYALGARRIGSQASEDPDTWKRSPWNYYAYSRLIRNADEPAETILRDFFSGYYREASEPMLRYYRAMEDQMIRNDIPFGINGRAFPIPVLAEMDRQLTAAEKLAAGWVVKGRVADARVGFNHLLKTLKLTRAAWQQPTSYPEIDKAGAEYTIQAATARINGSGAHQQFRWMTPVDRARVGDQLYFSAAGTYQVTVEMESGADSGTDTAVYVGSQRQTQHVVKNTPAGQGQLAAKEYSFRFQVQPGVWEVAVENTAGALLYVSRIRIKLVEGKGNHE